jgi:TRAP-type C4-dicarboxylate transport system substrate-binding protein
MWDAMGANPTPMAWGEVITSLSLGQIDALDHSLGVFNDFNLHEIAPYVTLTNHASSPFPVFVSLDWINGLPSDLRAIFEEGVHLMCEQQRAEERGLEMDYIARFKAEGATVEELTKAEVDALIESVKPVYDMWRDKVGSDLIDAWLATVPN